MSSAQPTLMAAEKSLAYLLVFHNNCNTTEQTNMTITNCISVSVMFISRFLPYENRKVTGTIKQHDQRIIRNVLWTIIHLKFRKMRKTPRTHAFLNTSWVFMKLHITPVSLYHVCREELFCQAFKPIYKVLQKTNLLTYRIDIHILLASSCSPQK